MSPLVSFGAAALGVLGTFLGLPSWNVYCAAACVLLFCGGVFSFYLSRRDYFHRLFAKVVKTQGAQASSLKFADGKTASVPAARQSGLPAASAAGRAAAAVVTNNDVMQSGSNAVGQGAAFTNVQQAASQLRRPVLRADPLSRKLEFG